MILSEECIVCGAMFGEERVNNSVELNSVELNSVPGYWSPFQLVKFKR